MFSQPSDENHPWGGHEQPGRSGPLPTLGEHRALIVDHSTLNHRLLHRLCSAWGLHYGAAHSGAAALAQLRWAAQTRRPFDLVLFAQHLPDAAVPDLAKEILADPLIPRPVLVMLKTREGPPPPAQLEAHGVATAELTPLHPEKLHAVISQLLTAPSCPTLTTVRGTFRAVGG